MKLQRSCAPNPNMSHRVTTAITPETGKFHIKILTKFARLTSVTIYELFELFKACRG